MSVCWEESKLPSPRFCYALGVYELQNVQDLKWIFALLSRLSQRRSTGSRIVIAFEKFGIMIED